MRYLRYLALLGIFMLTASYSKAQVSVGIGVGPGYGYVGAAPVCSYGYYDYYPYACAPYGFYGPDYLSAVSLLAPARGTAATMAVADTATMDAGVATLGAIATTASMVVATTTTTTVAPTATPVAAAAIMGAAMGTPATAMATLVVATAIPVMAVVNHAAQVAVATMVVMGVKAPTATEAVDPAAADIGNSPQIIQQRKRTAGSICCQPFSIVRQLPVVVGPNPILRPPPTSGK